DRRYEVKVHLASIDQVRCVPICAIIGGKESFELAVFLPASTRQDSNRPGSRIACGSSLSPRRSYQGLSPTGASKSSRQPPSLFRRTACLTDDLQLEPANEALPKM